MPSASLGSNASAQVGRLQLSGAEAPHAGAMYAICKDFIVTGSRCCALLQVQYAALDAYCLLQLLDEWAAAVPPAQLPMHEQPASSSPLHEQPGSPAESAEAEQQAAKQPEETLLSADNCQGVAELSIQLAVLSAEATADASEPASAEQPHPMGERSSEGTSVPADATAGPSVPAQELSSWPLSPLQLADEAPVQAWPQQAALHWGCRLEMLNRQVPCMVVADSSSCQDACGAVLGYKAWMLALRKLYIAVSCARLPCNVECSTAPDETECNTLTCISCAGADQ